MNKLKKSMIDWLYNKFVQNDNWTYIIKRFIYIFCFYGLCSLDQIAGSALPYVLHGSKHYTGVFVAVIILTAYKLRDFLKLPYYIWTISYLLFCLLTYGFVVETAENEIALKADLIGIGLYGVIIIRLIYLYVIEKKVPVKRWILFSLCIGMLFLMTLIRTDFDWPLPIFIMCLFFFQTDFKKKDLNNLLYGMLNGIILSFFVIQGQALMHRPYDKIRYEGIYAQPSLNALFYLYAYVAVLAKLYLAKLKKWHVIIRIPFILLAGIIVCTMLFTGSRAAFLTAIVLSLIYVFFMMISTKKHKVIVLFVNSIILFLSIAACILPTYWLIRYIPARVNEPIYYIADEWYGLDKKVQKNDPIDSGKYIELGEAVDMMLDRYLWFMDNELIKTFDHIIRGTHKVLTLTLQVDAAELIETVKIGDEIVEPGSDSSNPLVWTGKNGEGFYDVRIDIYRYFLNKLELIGDKNAVQGVWITETFYASHCHNVFIQIAYDFGIIIGIVFIIIVLFDYFYVAINLNGNKKKSISFCLFVLTEYITLFVFFGMLEIDWLYGQFSFIIFFLLQYLLFYKEAEEHKMIDRR